MRRIPLVGAARFIVKAVMFVIAVWVFLAPGSFLQNFIPRPSFWSAAEWDLVAGIMGHAWFLVILLAARSLKLIGTLLLTVFTITAFWKGGEALYGAYGLMMAEAPTSEFFVEATVESHDLLMALSGLASIIIASISTILMMLPPGQIYALVYTRMRRLARKERWTSDEQHAQGSARWMTKAEAKKLFRGMPGPDLSVPVAAPAERTASEATPEKETA